MYLFILFLKKERNSDSRSQPRGLNSVNQLGQIFSNLFKNSDDTKGHRAFTLFFKKKRFSSEGNQGDFMIPYVRGVVTPQAHVNVPEGLVEEEYARKGFFGAYAHLYRAQSPVGWTQIDGDLKPRAYDLNEVIEAQDFLTAKKSFLENNDVKLHYAKFAQSMDSFFRNADADEVLFVHEGSGLIETDFGPLNYEEGDYLLIPRGTVYRLHPNFKTFMLVIESFSEVGFPDKGMLGIHALFDPAVIRVPTPNPELRIGNTSEWTLKIQRLGKLTTVTYPFYPINTVGWKGDLTVKQLNVRDIRPVMSEKYHLPPSAHTTFVAQNFVICSFLPRPLENEKYGAMKVPFYHSNIDFDEVLFYHKGEFFSRTGIKPGMITFHPQGIHHGPQEGAVKRTNTATYTNEVAVMIDTKYPLFPTKEAETVENKNYWQSWRNPNGN